MATTLFVTVGGSHQPIVTAVKSLEPDRTIFICSDGSRGSISQILAEGTPCEVRRGSEVIERLPNIPTQLGLGDFFNADTDLVRLENPDDLADCYQLIVAKIRELQQEASSDQIYADYTGGTKTMSLALGMAAFDSNIPLFLTTSATRENLIKVERGESTERAPTTLVTVERTLNQILPSFLEKYNYPAAIAQLQSLLQSLELPPEQKRRIRELRDCCAGLDAWDRFDHAQAWLLLEPRMKQIQQLGLFLKRVMHSRSVIDPAFQANAAISGHGYEIVEDLLLNAERRAAQERYDDAVGRIYRALELLVQIRLKQVYGIQTGDVDITKLPEDLREEYTNKRSSHNGKIQLALRNSYELLSQLANEPLGTLYRERANAIIDALMIRNNSLFAHGFKPISSQDYHKVNNVIVGFIESGITVVTSSKLKFQSVQFPITLSL